MGVRQSSGLDTELMVYALMTASRIDAARDGRYGCIYYEMNMRCCETAGVFLGTGPMGRKDCGVLEVSIDDSIHRTVGCDRRVDMGAVFKYIDSSTSTPHSSESDICTQVGSAISSIATRYV